MSTQPTQSMKARQAKLPLDATSSVASASGAEQPEQQWPDWLGGPPKPLQVIQTARGPVALPLLDVRLVPIEKVRANAYNPNHVSPHNMELLAESILANGFCFGVVTVYNPADDMLDIVDGFHRYLEFRDDFQSPVLPVVVLQQDIVQRMQATVQFNRARGVHQVELMSDLVRSLVDQEVDADEIAVKLGMEPEEVYRLLQMNGALAAVYKHQLYSRAWEMVPVAENDDETAHTESEEHEANV